MQRSDSAATARGKKESKKTSARATRNLRRSRRFAAEGKPAAAKTASFASSCSGGGSSSGGCAIDEGKLPLRFRGFEANDAGKACICCYQVANITVNFMCEVGHENAERETHCTKHRKRAVTSATCTNTSISYVIRSSPRGVTVYDAIYQSEGESNPTTRGTFVVHLAGRCL